MTSYDKTDSGILKLICSNSSVCRSGTSTIPPVCNDLGESARYNIWFCRAVGPFDVHYSSTGIKLACRVAEVAELVGDAYLMRYKEKKNE